MNPIHPERRSQAKAASEYLTAREVRHEIKRGLALVGLCILPMIYGCREPRPSHGVATASISHDAAGRLRVGNATAYEPQTLAKK